VESMLRHAKIAADWTDAPDRDAIKAKDRERLLEQLLAPVEVDDGDRELAERLLAERTPAVIAAMLVHAHRAKMPEPEDLIANTPAAQREAQKERHRPGFEDIVWFRMDLGRRQNADPRWILPLLCRRGHITRNEIGAIRIGADETYFHIPRQIAQKVADAAARSAQDDSDDQPVTIELSDSAPRDAARDNRKRHASRDSGDAPRVKAKPRFKKFDKTKSNKRDKPVAGGKPRKSKKPAPQHERK